MFGLCSGWMSLTSVHLYLVSELSRRFRCLLVGWLSYVLSSTQALPFQHASHFFACFGIFRLAAHAVPWAESPDAVPPADYELFYPL
ncbi:hypothetical protein GALMADRAFT_235549 [Galerina marginata CBS 339.88]|uniref:Uncharacterized protein n=1 Tax=Galerina marginata (strain CBS 339.88) TaxID=685588 RepID=A0A067TU37_GALM3|nr:hypothetical protein GALMADRAFT_235549 [Galerina marginata CBS 339.88]